MDKWLILQFGITKEKPSSRSGLPFPPNRFHQVVHGREGVPCIVHDMHTAISLVVQSVLPWSRIQLAPNLPLQSNSRVPLCITWPCQLTARSQLGKMHNTGQLWNTQLELCYLCKRSSRLMWSKKTQCRTRFFWTSGFLICLKPLHRASWLRITRYVCMEWLKRLFWKARWEVE